MRKIAEIKNKITELINISVERKWKWNKVPLLLVSLFDKFNLKAITGMQSSDRQKVKMKNNK